MTTAARVPERAPALQPRPPLANPGGRVRIAADDGQSLRESVGRGGRVVRACGPFVLVDVDGLGVRGCLEDYLEAEPMAEQPTQTLTRPGTAPADRPCRACHKPLLFLPQSVDGKLIPLDARTQVYFAVRDDRGGRFAHPWRDFFRRVGQLNERDTHAALSQLVDVEACGVSHFATCPEAGQFGVKGRIDAAHRRLMADTLARVADRLDGPGRTVGRDECREIVAMCRAAVVNQTAEAK